MGKYVTTLVSIHASRAGRDPWGDGLICTGSRFNPRVPCGTRLILTLLTKQYLCFNPRVPCGTRQSGRNCTCDEVCFNPRVPCGTRLTPWLFVELRTCFNPRVPCGTRPNQISGLSFGYVSIHASRAGRDVKSFLKFYNINVSIHASRAGRDPAA